MSQKRDVRTPVPLPGAGGSIAEEIVATIGRDRLRDIKFLIEPSNATRDEILAAALVWIQKAEHSIKKQELGAV